MNESRKIRFTKEKFFCKIYVLNSYFYSFAVNDMDLATCITISFTLGTCLNEVVTFEECTGQGQSPEVKLGISIRQPKPPTPKETLSLNNHLQSNSETKHPIENDRTPTRFLEDQASSSVIFNEILSLVLTKSSYRVISYISFEQHIKSFSEIDNLLQAIVDQTNTYMQTKSFPPYYRQLPGESHLVQERKDQWIQVQLQELSYELHLVMRNFELIKERFLEITGQMPTFSDDLYEQEQPTNMVAPIILTISTLLKRSVTSSIFKFLFGAEDNSEAINVLKQNVATLMANDELHEKHLKYILKSQQINVGEIKINRDLLRQVKKELAQINFTFNEITFNTQMLFSLASFQVLASQLRHRVSIIRDALFGLQMNLDILYHHCSVMVDNKLTPEMISPKNLYDILQDVQNEIRDHPQLSLLEELYQDTIYKFYKTLRFEVTMEQKLMLGVLQVPLIEKNKQFQLFKIYNLPIPLPEANLQVQYNLTFKYLAITTGAQYIAFPQEEEIMGCQLTGGAFCELNTALFPTIGLKSYEFALYQKDHEWIIEACRVKTTPFISDQAVSLEPNYWVVITQKLIVLHINCLQHTSYKKVQHPIDIIHLEDGCEATFTTLVLPGHSPLIKEDNYLARTHSVTFKLQYTEIQDFQLLKQIFPCQLSSKELEQIGNSIPEPKVV